MGGHGSSQGILEIHQSLISGSKHLAIFFGTEESTAIGLGISRGSNGGIAGAIFDNMCDRLGLTPHSGQLVRLRGLNLAV